MGTIGTISSERVCSRDAPRRDYSRKWAGRGNPAERLIALIDLWIDRRRGRIALARLTRQDLDDIGISCAQAEFEASRPFWDGTSDYR